MNGKCVQVFLLIQTLISSGFCEMGNFVESEEVSTKTRGLGIIEKLREQIKLKEQELEDAEKTNRNFEKMIQLVNIMGQVDTFLTDRTKLVLKKLAMLVDDLDDSKSKKSVPRHNIKF